MALLAFAVFAFASEAAEAQSTDPIWSATMTVGEGSPGTSNSNKGYHKQDRVGSLTSQTMSHQGATAEVTDILLYDDDNRLYLRTGSSAGTTPPTGSFNLCFDGTAFTFNPWQGLSAGASDQVWKTHNSSGLTWSVGDMVAVSLVTSAQACPSSDRTPEFAAGASIPDHSLAVNRQVSLAAFPAASGGDGTLTYSVTPPLPTGLTLSSTTRRITGAPSAVSAAQTYTYKVTDSDTSEPDSATLTFRLGVVADAMPSFGDRSVDVPTLTKDQAMTPVTLPLATGGNAPLAHEFLQQLPDGLTVEKSGASYMLKGTPTARQRAETYEWRVTDADGDMAKVDIEIAIAQGTAPSFNGTVGNQSYTRGTDIGTVTLPAATGDGTVEYSLDGLPSGLNFDPMTRQLTGTPDETQAATEYTYKAIDGDNDVTSLTFTIEVGASAVAGLSVDPVAGSTDTLEVSWTSSSGVGLYTVQWKSGAQSYNTSDRIDSSAENPTNTSHRITGLAANTAHDVRVSFYDGAMPTRKLLAQSEESGTTHAATVSLSASPNPVGAGSPVTVTATLSSALGSNVTIPVTLTPGTAMADDYGTLTGIAITAGQTAGTGQVTTVDDSDTGDETFTVMLGSPLPAGVTPGSTSSVAVTIGLDVAPDFGDRTVADQVFPKDKAVDLTLPEATGGDGALTYSIVETLPTGLMFSSTTRKITGTPTAETAETSYTYKATDSDATGPDSAELTFYITVGPPEVPGLSVDPVDGATDRLDVSWDTVTGAAQYGLEWKSGNQEYSDRERNHLVTSGTTTTYRIGSLGAGTEHFVRVTASTPPATPSWGSPRPRGRPMRRPRPSRRGPLR
ncbi:MAG: hypothetical protein F4Y03_01875 [Alphaproteobacteria bacterium]|nr:hypothetical protein [Alphaproteobacteria bacterium]